MGADAGVTGLTLHPAGRLRGSVDIPGDKSISHRALLLAALADGVSRVSHRAPGADQESMLTALDALGIDIEVEGDTVEVLGVGLRGRAAPSGVELDCGNSGATIRFLSGTLAAIPGAQVRLSGDASLRSRPMERVAAPLRRMGAAIETTGGYAPVSVSGRQLHGVHHDLAVASAQVKTAILLAALNAEGVTSITEPGRSRDHTERMLARLGVRIETGDVVRLEPPDRLPAFELTVPGDPSAAAFWAVLAAVHPDAELTLRGVCLNPTRAGFLDVLRRMGAEIEVGPVRDDGGEQSADITVQGSRLIATDITASEVPGLVDEVPVLAVAAALADGTSTFRGLGELRVKETDRVDAVRTQLGAMGAAVEVSGDDMSVTGTDHLTGTDVDSGGDHRVAMMLAVAATVARGSSRLLRASAAGVSYPGFYQDLRSLTAK